MNRNYQRELEQLLKKIEKEKTDKEVPSLLLHSCCAPCSSYVLEFLSKYFEITVFYYNPNIYPPEEYEHRAKEQKMFIERIPHLHPIHFLEGKYDPNQFYCVSNGLELVKEGGERCYKCYRLRLEEAAKIARNGEFDYFTTTLSISPYKNVHWLNEIGESLEAEYGVTHLPSDFKKKNGYKRSIELSEEYNMYRQDYCGCIYSMKERNSKKIESVSVKETAE